MSQIPGPGNPNHWVHQRLQGIEFALYALLQATLSQADPSGQGIDADDVQRLSEAQERLRPYAGVDRLG